MTDRSEDDLTALMTDLLTTLEDLETVVEPRTERGRPRPPTLRELMQFTSDVTIPAAILLLRTNIEALKLVRRAIRLADGRPRPDESGTSEVRRRASQLSRVTLARLDDALADLQSAVEGTPQDEDARDLLQEARDLRAELADRLAESEGAGAPGTRDDETAGVTIDVDAELQSLKDDIDDRPDDADGEPSEGADDGS